ncbi:hypothetical protein JXA02_04355 [candidate division KSB1 bacterium]|nr:hypothetical protein [candidate division KSB1 bacterium]RQW08958.1 MAG: hypothetical protein EH222_04895 [candidate division KSB1 bacterium]
MQRLLWFILTLTIVICGAYAILQVQADLFFAALWFLIYASLIRPVTNRMPARRFLICAAIILCGALWYVLNDALLRLVSANINSNPYGDYILAQLEFRLSLSIFILKIIKNSWLTDSRLFICIGLLLVHVSIGPQLTRWLFSRLPARLFEFIVTVFSHINIEASRYLATSLILACVNGALWCLACFLLQFDNFMLMTFLMFICAFLPHIGLIIAALLSLVFVETGLFLIQIGGLLITVALIWFIDHTLFQNQEQIGRYMPVTLLFFLPPLSYAAVMLLNIFIPLPVDHPFSAFFLAVPLVHIAALTSTTMQKYSRLIHKMPLQARTR